MKTHQTPKARKASWRDILHRRPDGRSLLSLLRRKKNRSGYLFVAINGAGLGHLTRCLAVARKIRELAPNEKIVFVTTSIAVPLVHQAGFVCHHTPPFAFIGDGVSSRQWNELFYENLAAVLRLHSPSTLIFDGSIPYDGLLSAMKDFEGINRVWIKRGLYKPTVDSDKLLLHTKQFDLTINPGELGTSTCTNVKNERSIATVAPILMLDAREMLDGVQARELLRLKEGVRSVFVQLGAGNIDETTELQKTIVETLRTTGVQVVLAQSPIALREPLHSMADVVLLDFPSSKYYKAFDFAILAGGYNSVNEAVVLGLPAIFIPNTKTVTDDQLRRCRAAMIYGDYEVLEDFDQDRLLQMAGRLIDRKRHGAGVRPAFRNGARHAAELILDLDSSRSGPATGT